MAKKKGSKVSAVMFPMEDIKTVLAKLRGDNSVTWKASVEAALRVLTWGVQFIPEDGGPAPMLGTRGGEAEEAQLAAQLETVVAAHEGHRSVGAPSADPMAAALPWQMIVPLLVTFLERWLARR